MNFQELRTAYLDMDYRDFTSTILLNMRDGLKNTASNEVKTLEDHKDYLYLLNSFRSSISANDQLHGTNFMKQITSMLSTGEDGVYDNSLRYIFELIQNVDDCDFIDSSDCALDIKFSESHGQIILTYNEIGFAPINVFAVTGIAEAAKNVQDGKAQIGEKGIGFKSVFGVAHRVWIQSGKFSFELDRSDFCVPIPVYDERYKEIQGTRLTLFVDPALVRKTYEKIARMYGRPNSVFQNNPILFLNKLTQLHFFTDEFDSLTFSVSKRSISGEDEGLIEKNVVIGAKLASRKGYNLNNSIQCVRYTMPIIFDRNQCISRYGSETELTTRALKMQIIFPNSDELPKLTKQGAFYSYLPTGVHLSVPLVCHVPFKLDASREHIDSQNENLWFLHCYHSFSVFLTKAYTDYASRYGNQIAYYVPAKSESFFCQDNEKAHCLNRPELSGTAFSHQKLFPSIQGGLHAATELCFFESKTPVSEPLLVNSLLNSTREIFEYPAGLTRDFGMEKIADIPEQLFLSAFGLNSSTNQIFCYLEKYHLLENNMWQTLASKISGSWISVPQIKAVFQHENCLKAFQRKSTDQKNHISPSGVLIQFPLSDAKDVLSIDPSGERFDPENFPTSLQQYFANIQYRCIVLDLELTDFFIADNVLILSGDILEALSDLCSSVQKQSLFGLQLKYRQVSRTLNNADNTLSNTEFLELLRSLRESQRIALGKDQYTNYIELLKQAGTNSAERFLNEILQNADDCTYASEVVPQFNLEIKGNTVTAQYNEQGFSKSNVRAITAIGESTKKRLANENSIGEKGVGFKSVFSVASKVEVHSGEFDFSLTKDKPTVPKIIQPINNEATSGTTMILYLDKPISAQLQTPSNILHLCLCLRRLKEIKIGNVHIQIQDIENQRMIVLNDIKYTYRIVRYSFNVTNLQLLEERSNHQRVINPHQNIFIYLPETGEKNGCIYSGLPTTVNLNAPFYIDAPFELITSRDLIQENSWNTMVWGQVFLAYRKMLEEIAPDMRIRTLRYLPFDHKVFGRLESYQFNLFASAEHNAKLPTPSTFFYEAKIIPTFDSISPLSSPKEQPVIYPTVAQEFLEMYGTASRPLNRIVNTNKSEKYIGTLKALGCKDASAEELIRFLTNCIKLEANSSLASKYWNYLFEQYKSSKNNIPSSIRVLLKSYAIIPVLGVISGTTEYVKLSDKPIYTDSSATSSPSQYYVLNTKILSKTAFETIFGSPINEMDDNYKQLLYQNDLKQHLFNDEPQPLYYYLLNERKRNPAFKKWGIDVLRSHNNLVPLKNALGDISCNNVCFCDNGENYFGGEIVQAHCCSDECSSLAQDAGIKNISKLCFSDLKINGILSAYDIDDFMDDYLEHGPEILEKCIDQHLISDELMEKYHLNGLQKQEYIIDMDEFPNEPIHNLKNLQDIINNSPIQKIVKEERTRTVDCVQQENGTIELFDKTYARKNILRRYTPVGKNYCICQMCLKGKPDYLMEVNNIQRKPKYYWPAMRLSLCLECSKKFESLRSDPFWNAKFEQAILSANTSTPDPVKVPIGNVTITFTQTHLEQIKTILKKKLY